MSGTRQEREGYAKGVSYDLHDYLEDMEQEGYLGHVDAPETERVSEWRKGVQVSEMVVAGKTLGWVDAGLASVLEDINAAGYQSAQSCSGLQQDHEHKTSTTGGYIAWFAADLNEQQVERIKQAAAIAGLEFRHSDLFFLPAVSVRSDRLMDGTSQESVRLKATQETNAAWGVLAMPNGNEFLEWLYERDERRRLDIEARGGLAIKTDEDLMAAWASFAEALVRA
jgi:hypothetical protein